MNLLDDSLGSYDLTDSSTFGSSPYSGLFSSTNQGMDTGSDLQFDGSSYNPNVNAQDQYNNDNQTLASIGTAASVAAGIAFTPLAGVIVGTAFSVYGDIVGANQQASQEQADAANKRAMAMEVESRASFDNLTLIRQGMEAVGNERSQFAKGNVGVDSGSPLAVMESAYAETARKVYVSQTEADFKANQYLIGAASEDSTAANTQQTGLIKASGSILGGLSSRSVGTSLGFYPSGGGGGGGTD